MEDKDILGSSETTREPPFYWFQFDNYKQHHQLSHINTKKTQHFQFLEWFIGFAEGDGTFSMRQEDGRPRFLFEVGQKDPKILYKIKRILGFGRVSSFTRKTVSRNAGGEIVEKETEYWRYSVGDRRGLQRIMSIFNGNLVLPKRHAQFQNWVSKAEGLHSDDFSFDPRPVSPSLITGWLSGFIEAEGCFHARFAAPSARSLLTKRLVQKLTITQQEICGEIGVLKKILQLFESPTKVYLVKSTPNKEFQSSIQRKESTSMQSMKTTYRIEINSLESHKKVVHYLKSFPLKGNKQVAFSRWWRVYLARLEGEHLDSARLRKLEDLCKSINKGLTL